jgi:hypothetical protein
MIRMRWGLDISQHQLTWDELGARATLAEDAGLDGVWPVRPRACGSARSSRA